MARDYKHRAQPKTARHTAGWVWLLAGYLLGVFSVGLAWLKLTPPDAGGWIGVEPEGEPAVDTRGTSDETPQDSELHFDFYSMLPSMEVVVPEDELADPEPVSAQGPGAGTEPAARRKQYLLQVGSFRKEGDAERLKAELALLGFSSHIQRAEPPQSGVWYRVRTGPFDDTSRLRKARDRLEENGHRSLVIDLRKP